MADKKMNKKDMKKMATRIICLSVAAVMVLSAVIAAVLSQVW